MTESKILTGIYIWTNTKNKIADSYSVIIQKERLSKYASAMGWKIVDFYVDMGITVKVPTDRPTLRYLMEDVKSGKVNHILVYKLDRLIDSELEIAKLITFLKEHHCSVSSLYQNYDLSKLKKYSFAGKGV